MTEKEAYTKLQECCGIKIGDTIKVLRKAKDKESGWGTCWDYLMDEAIGKELVVKFINPNSGFLLEDNFWYPWFVLEKVKSGIVKKTGTKKNAYETLEQGWKQKHNIQIGDRVRVLRKAKSMECGWNNSWTKFMDDSVGSRQKVMDFGSYSSGLFLGNGYSYPWFVLEKVEEGPVEMTVAEVCKALGKNVKIVK